MLSSVNLKGFRRRGCHLLRPVTLVTSELNRRAAIGPLSRIAQLTFQHSMDSFLQSDALEYMSRQTRDGQGGGRRDGQVRLRVGQAKSLKRKRGPESEVASTK